MSAEDSHNTNLAIADTDDLERDIGDEVTPPSPPSPSHQVKAGCKGTVMKAGMNSNLQPLPRFTKQLTWIMPLGWF